MTTEYEAITEDEWKSLATTEITHLTDEEKDYLPAAWDEWIARVRRAAKAEALREAAEHIEEVVANAQPERAFTEHVLMEHGGPGYLRELATEYETGDQT